LGPNLMQVRQHFDAPLQAVLSHAPFQGRMSPGWAQTERHKDVPEHPLEGGMRRRGRVQNFLFGPKGPPTGENPLETAFLSVTQ
jgi:hypothetical protein